MNAPGVDVLHGGIVLAGGEDASVENVVAQFLVERENLRCAVLEALVALAWDVLLVHPLLASVVLEEAVEHFRIVAVHFPTINKS